MSLYQNIVHNKHIFLLKWHQDFVEFMEKLYHMDVEEKGNMYFCSNVASDFEDLFDWADHYTFWSVRNSSTLSLKFTTDILTYLTILLWELPIFKQHFHGEPLEELLHLNIHSTCPREIIKSAKCYKS